MRFEATVARAVASSCEPLSPVAAGVPGASMRLPALVVIAGTWSARIKGEGDGMHEQLEAEMSAAGVDRTDLIRVAIVEDEREIREGLMFLIKS